MINEEQLKGQINSTERQLLWDIREELRKLNKYFESQQHPIEERTICLTTEKPKPSRTRKRCSK